MCWANRQKRSQDVQLIIIGEIKTADLERPNSYGSYTIDIRIDEDTQHAFDQLWKSGKWGEEPEFKNPVNSEGIIRISTKINSINRHARKNKLTLLSDDDPFPGLHDGSGMHKGNTALIPRTPQDFTEGTVVAVEATVSSYDFTNADGDRIFGYSLSIREVYWLSEYQEENWPTTPTTNRKKTS
jgi:hypothetical protein